MWTHLWLFIFLKRKQIPNSWIFCMQYKVFVTLLNNHRFLFCWLVSRSRKCWDFANDVSGADRINLSYTGGWNTSTLFNKRYTSRNLKCIVCHDMGLVVQFVALSDVLLFFFMFYNYRTSATASTSLCKIRYTHNWNMHWKKNNFILNNNKPTFICN